MTDNRGISILYRVLCFAVKLLETEYQLGKTPRSSCCRCTGQDTGPQVIVKHR